MPNEISNDMMLVMLGEMERSEWNYAKCFALTYRQRDIEYGTSNGAMLKNANK